MDIEFVVLFGLLMLTILIALIPWPFESSCLFALYSVFAAAIAAYYLLRPHLEKPGTMPHTPTSKEER